MDKKLFASAIVKFLSGLILVALPLFLSAGSFGYWNAWLLMGILFIPMFIGGLILMKKNPELLRKRLDVKEKQSQQKTVVALSGIMFLMGFIVAGLDNKFQWTKIPEWLVIVGAVIFLISYGLYAEVMRENVYLSRTVEVQENQKVIDTGLYGIVRHPMYAVTVLMFLAMPIVLGSWIAFIIFLTYPFIIAGRIINEEKVLEEGLDGYKEYKKKVKYRIVPFIW